MYFTGTAGGDYDAIPYNARASEQLSIEKIVSAARGFGLTGAPKDILDLGCGYGKQLALAAPAAAGRLVGVDASEVHCAGARSTLAPWSERAEVLHRDFDTLEPGELGEFDIIYCIGTLYTLPTSTRDKVLALVRACLRPGGVLVVSYYAGTRALIKTAISAYVRRLYRPGDSIESALARVRENLEFTQRCETPLAIDAVREQIRLSLASGDVVLSHENLGHGIVVQSTLDINAQLTPANIHFLFYTTYDASSFHIDSGTRLLLAETLDLLEGGYRHALFGRDQV